MHKINISQRQTERFFKLTINYFYFKFIHGFIFAQQYQLFRTVVEIKFHFT